MLACLERPSSNPGEESGEVYINQVNGWLEQVWEGKGVGGRNAYLRLLVKLDRKKSLLL